MVQNSPALGLLVLELAIVDPALGTDEPTLAVGVALAEVPHVVGPIRVE